MVGWACLLAAGSEFVLLDAMLALEATSYQVNFWGMGR
jgi:hypothetical protein